jgi:ketosteroid isomerase-like protein
VGGMTTPTTIPTTQLPATIRAYLAAHAAGEAEAALRTFAPTAQVVDEGRTFRGTEQILGFLKKAGGEFTYTVELIGAQRVDDAHWVAVNRLEGDFPGGVAELRYRFTLLDDLIAELVIAP